MTQLFDPASHTFWRNVKERAVAPVTAFGRNPARWDVWAPETVPSVPTWYASKADVTLLGCIELLQVCAVIVVYCDTDNYGLLQWQHRHAAYGQPMLHL